MDPNSFEWVDGYLTGKSPEQVSWQMFVKDVYGRYLPTRLVEPAQELVSLQMTSTVEHYHKAFEALKCQVKRDHPTLTELYFVEMYTRGLSKRIRFRVEKDKPRPILEAYCLALKEEAIMLERPQGSRVLTEVNYDCYSSY